MIRRPITLRLGLVAAGLLAALAVGIAALTYSEPAPTEKVFLANGDDPAIQKALILSTSVIRRKTPDGRLPEFLTWPTRTKIHCNSQQKAARLGTFLVGDADHDVHNKFREPNGPPPDVEDNDGFYYNELSEERLCEPVYKVNPGGGSYPTPPKLHSGLVTDYVNQLKIDGFTPPESIDHFDVGSRAAAAIWKSLDRKTVDDLTIKLRDNSPGSSGTTIRVSIPPKVLDLGTQGHTQICQGWLSEPVVVENETPDFHLDDFYWVQLKEGDYVKGKACGDILVLVGFHLIEKVAQTTPISASDWLWSTYWWDKNDQRRAHVKPSADAAGNQSDAWANYVIDATFRSDVEIRNPWKERETPDSNCAFCHNHAMFPVSLNEPRDKGDVHPIPDASTSDFIFAGPKKGTK